MTRGRPMAQLEDLQLVTEIQRVGWQITNAGDPSRSSDGIGRWAAVSRGPQANTRAESAFTLRELRDRVLKRDQVDSSRRESTPPIRRESR